jgi:hypothetical protein
MKKKRAKVEKVKKIKGYIGIAYGNGVAEVTAARARTVWRRIGEFGLWALHSKESLRQHWKVVPCTITYPTPKRKAKD